MIYSLYLEVGDREGKRESHRDRYTKYTQDMYKYYKILDIVLVTNRVHVRAQDKNRPVYKMVLCSAPVWCFYK